ncbi:MAG: hypothetical protein IPJ48_04250 [Propionivibrio sp.]|uniref:Uncharacterized protein n=1 Tax=Candidatus Propionivibrio dominans TaxID=2954373 RepID=A0A9D7FDJ1_9RHOO|nr:hypothetical protein [Candidatus Propionivibrio dominans]
MPEDRGSRPGFALNTKLAWVKEANPLQHWIPAFAGLTAANLFSRRQWRAIVFRLYGLVICAVNYQRSAISA